MDGVHTSGGSLQLGELIDDHGQWIAADLMEYYTVDIRDVLVPDSGVTPRWLLTLIAGLGEESRYAASCRGGQHLRGWTQDRYLSVFALETQRATQWIHTAANSTKRPPFPKPFPLPKAKQQKPEKRAEPPGSFAFIAKQHLAEAKKRKAS